jgi:hypothetical protein
MVPDRWRTGPRVAVGVVTVILLMALTPTGFGPWVSAAVFAAALAFAAFALVRGSMEARVVMALVAFGAGALAGIFGWYIDRFPDNERLEAAIVALVPSGFRENRDARQECDGWGCSPYVSRTYTGAGPMTGDALVALLRRSCYTDAAIETEGSYAGAVVGTCRSRNVEMYVSVRSQGTETVLGFSAYRRP